MTNLNFNFTELPNARTAGTIHKYRLPPPRLYRPILVLLAQTVMLVLTIAYIIYTATDYRQTSRAIFDLTVNKPASATAAFTLVGSLLSLVVSKFTNEAVRFAVNVTLGDSKRRGIRLFTFYAATKVIQRSPILKFDSRLNWTILTIFNIILFTVQTSAWTTLATPRLIPMKTSVNFQDGNFGEPTFTGNAFNVDTSRNQLETLISGYDSARQTLNLPASFAHNGYEFNGSTLGILPLPHFYTDSYSEWTSITARQQGATADVKCQPVQNNDPAIQWPAQTSIVAGNSIIQSYLCCNCTANDTSGTGYVYLFYNFPDVGHPTQTVNFIVFTVCPYQNNSNEQGIIIYTTSSSSAFSKTCTIKPRLLNATVTYNYTSANAGTIGIDSQTPGPSLDLSNAVVANFVNDLKNSFFFAQSATGNEIIAALDVTAHEYNPALNTSTNGYANLMDQLMADFIRGIFEFSITGARESLLQNYASELHNSTVFYEESSARYLEVVVWGHVPNIRTPIMLAPLVIMSLNIIFLCLSFYRCGEMISEGRWDDLRHVMHFDPMDLLHVLAACKSSNVGDLAFPGYDQDIAKYVELVEIELRE